MASRRRPTVVDRDYAAGLDERCPRIPVFAEPFVGMERVEKDEMESTAVEYSSIGRRFCRRLPDPHDRTTSERRDLARRDQSMCTESETPRRKRIDRIERC